MKLNRRAFVGGISLASVAFAQDHRMDPAQHSAEAATNVKFHAFDPALPPLPAGNTTRIHMTAEEVPICIKPGLVVSGWTFDGDIPGRVIHVRQGDRVEFTLTNHGMMPHSMDFHCALS